VRQDDDLAVRGRNPLCTQCRKSHASKKWCKANGVTAALASRPSNLDEENPANAFVDVALAASSEMLAKKLYNTLRNAREATRRRTTRRTIAGTPKVEGRLSMKEMHPNLGAVLKKLLKKPFFRRMGVDNKPKTLDDIAKHLKKNKITTKAR